MRNAVRRGSSSAACAAGAPCRARSPSGVPPRLCPWDSRIPRCDPGPGFAERAPSLAGVSRRRPPRLQRAPRVPVLMPADMMSETARERPAKPSAGAVLARRSGLPPDRLLHAGEDCAPTHKRRQSQVQIVTEIMIRTSHEAAMDVSLWGAKRTFGISAERDVIDPFRPVRPEICCCAIWYPAYSARRNLLL